MSVPIIRGLSLLHLRLYPCHHRVATTILTYRLWSTLTGPAPLSDHFAASLSAGQKISVLNNGDPSKIPKCDDTNSIKRKNEEAEMLKDIEPVICATKRILHSDRFFLHSLLYHLEFLGLLFLIYVMVVKNLDFFSKISCLLFMIHHLLNHLCASASFKLTNIHCKWVELSLVAIS